jgi:hypothetical protein
VQNCALHKIYGYYTKKYPKFKQYYAIANKLNGHIYDIALVCWFFLCKAEKIFNMTGISVIMN